VARTWFSDATPQGCSASERQTGALHVVAEIKNPDYRRFAIVTELFATRQPERHVIPLGQLEICHLKSERADHQVTREARWLDRPG
jgi:hypothetical protein